MAESYSVKALLSAKDSGFSSTLKEAIGVTDTLADKIKNGFAFGVLTGIGQQAFNTLIDGAKGLISEIDSSNASWKTFQGNLEMLNWDSSAINAAKTDLQEFAQQTVYSSSDMATTFAQLAAVGVKDTAKLVKGFGGLAAAAENPQQAMKSLSQQATQMAAKPKVAWEDFKIMLEQTPAGMAAVAKAMGMTASELVAAVQKGKVKTEDFLAVIAEVGSNEEFSKLATEAKTVGQAMDGLQETIGNKLTPAFEVLNQVGIGVVNDLADSLDGIDAKGLAERMQSVVDTVGEGLSFIKEEFSGVGTEVGEAVEAVSEALGIADVKFSKTDAMEVFKNMVKTVADSIRTASDFIEEHADTIGEVLPWVLKLAVAYKGFKTVSSIVPGVSMFTGEIKSLAGKGISGLAGKLFGVSKSQEEVGKTSSKSGKQMLNSAKSYVLMGVAILTISLGFTLLAQSAIALSNAGGPAISVMAGLVVAVGALSLGMMAMMKSINASPKKMSAMATVMLAMGAAVLMVSVGFALLTQSSIALANAGGSAIAVMVGMVATIALLAAGAAALAPVLTAGAGGLIAFGAAMVLVGLGAVLAGAALTIVSTVLPTITEYGTQGAAAIIALGGSMIVFAVGAGLAGAACLVLGAGLLTVGIGIAAVAVAVTVLAAGILMIASGALIAATSFALMASALPVIVSLGKEGAGSLIALAGGLTVFSTVALVAGTAAIALGAGLTVLGTGLLVVSAGVLILGAGVLMLATSALLASTALTLISGALPVLSQYGLQGAGAIVVLSGAMLTFAVGAGAAGAATILLAAGLIATAVSVTLLAVGFAALGVSLVAVSLGIVALALSIGVAAGALALLNLALPITIKYGAQASNAMAALGIGFLSLGAGAAVAGAACVVLGAGLLVASAGGIAFGVAMTVGTVGTLAMAAALKAVNSQTKTIAKNAKSAEKSLDSMTDSVSIVESGLDALGSKAKSAMNELKDAFNDTAKEAKSSGSKVGSGFTQGMQAGLSQAPSVALMITTQVGATLSAGRSSAYSAGAYISLGFAQGMLSQLAVIQSAAAKMASAADAAVRAKARIHSPSKVSEGLGKYWGEGFVNGIADMARDAWNAAQELVSIPTVATPNLAMAYDGELSADYEYYRNAQYVIEVPLFVDGKKFAKANATYMQDELDKRQTRDSRKHGYV